MAYSGSQLPPSFSPSGRDGGRQRPADAPAQSYPPQPNPGRQQAQSSRHAPPSFAPGGRRSQQQPFQQPSSFAPRAANPRTPDAAQRTAGSLPSYIAPTPGVGAGDAAAGRHTGSANVQFGPGDSSPQPARPRKRHGKRRIVVTVLVALLAAVLVFAWSQVAWINRSLNHQDMLSGAANTAGSTWLILGSDARDGTVGGTQEEVPGFRNDTILVLTKPSSGPASLVSIPRDSYVTVDGQDMKINAVAENYGYPQLVKTVEGITGITIDHVALIGFSGVMGIVDAVGGVNLCLDYDVDDAYSGLKWTAGCHTADGTTALAFARMRYSDPQGDIGRAERQRQVISAIMTKVSGDKSIRNYSTLHKVGDATLGALTVDENSNAFTLLQMAQAFREATGSGGVTGSVYYSSVDYQPSSGIGSCVLLDDDKNADLFKALSRGTQAAGTVGGYTGA